MKFVSFRITFLLTISLLTLQTTTLWGQDKLMEKLFGKYYNEWEGQTFLYTITSPEKTLRISVPPSPLGEPHNRYAVVADKWFCSFTTHVGASVNYYFIEDIKEVQKILDFVKEKSVSLQKILTSIREIAQEQDIPSDEKKKIISNLIRPDNIKTVGTKAELSSLINKQKEVVNKFNTNMIEFAFKEPHSIGNGTAFTGCAEIENGKCVRIETACTFGNIGGGYRLSSNNAIYTECYSYDDVKSIANLLNTKHKETTTLFEEWETLNKELSNSNPAISAV